MPSWSRHPTSSRRRLSRTAIAIAVGFVMPGVLAWNITALAEVGPPPVFQDSGQTFGTNKGHYGRCNAWADLDGNGLLDVITGGHDTGLLAYYQESPMEFRRVDSEIGLGRFNAPLYGILLLDFDRDGDKDIVLNQVGFGEVTEAPSLRYLRNNGSGVFFEATSEVGFQQIDRGFGLAALDYDHDGWLDIYVVNHRSANALYHNLGGGFFEDVTAAAGVSGTSSRLDDSTGITTLDYDRDGWTDIFVTRRDELSAEFPFGNNLLFHNEGDGTFTNRAVEAGVAGFSHDFVASSADFNNDGWPDLYVATFNFGPNGTPATQSRNRTYLNQGDGTFVDVTLGGGADYIGGTMGLAADDVDNDGAVDIYVGNGGPFELQVEDQIFYHGNGDGSFLDHTDLAGLTSDARGHGSTWLDIDRDGDLDLFASLGGHTVGSEHHDVLYLNVGPTGRSLEVSLQGNDCPLEGIGVAVEAYAPGVELRREIRATGGFDSMRPPVAWFGLGTTIELDSLVVNWPCGMRQRLMNVATDDRLNVVEPRVSVANFDLTLRVRRDAEQRVRIELSGAIDALYRDSLELSRQVGLASSWTRLPIQVQSQGGSLAWTDGTAPPEQSVRYLLRAQLGADQDSYSGWITRESELGPAISTRLSLRASPNPFSGLVQLRASGSAEHAVLRIYDIRGREVRVLRADRNADGAAVMLWTWDGLDATGQSVARGAYVADLRVDGRRVQRSILKLQR